MVDVSSQNNSVSINVSSSGNSASIKATPDTALYYSEKSREWAIGSKIVNNEDYSSKYYANKAKVSEENARVYENAVKDTYNTFIAESGNITDEVRNVGQESVNSIETSRLNAVDSINTVKNTALDSINATKTNILKDIEFVAEGEKEEIQELADKAKDDIESTGFYMRDDKLYFINSEGQEEEFKSGGGGLEIGDIGFTQMAIDETKGKRRILNGQLIIQDQYVQFTNIIKESVALNPSLACTESEWQTEVTMNTFGLCGKFVIDDEGGTIRLPKYPNYFIVGLANIASVVGNGMTLGLTNGTNNLGLQAANSSINQALTVYDGNYGKSVGSTQSGTRYGNNNTLGVTTDPTKSGIEAQINKKQIAGQYFIQVATGAETEDNIINEIELNNPFSLLDYKYSEYELNNLSWLRSNGQYNSKAIYPAVYDLLLKIYNGTETKAGVSVKLATENYSDTDFVLNTADETFRLPIKVKLASGKAVVGNGIALGLTNGTNYYGMVNGLTNVNGALGLYTGDYGNSVSSTHTIANYNTNQGVIGITTDPTKSGLELSDSDLYLYFYVGETVQNANLINAGRIEEKLSGKLDRNTIKSYITETYVNGTSWYRIWSDGWCEQGGVTSGKGYSTAVTITFIKAFADTNYNVTLTNASNQTSYIEVACGITSNAKMNVYGQSNHSLLWQASGYIN